MKGAAHWNKPYARPQAPQVPDTQEAWLAGTVEAVEATREEADTEEAGEAEMAGAAREARAQGGAETDTVSDSRQSGSARRNFPGMAGLLVTSAK